MRHARTPREHARSSVRISCELTIAGETFHASIKNLSTGGAAIRLSEPLKVGDVVTISFFVTQDGIEDPDRSPLECAASIRWTEPAGPHGYDAGMQFLSLSAEQRALLRGLLQQAA